MSLSFLSPNRTVLLVADEALYIYAAASGGVRLVDTVVWDADDFEKIVTRIIVKDCGKKPILILNDMVEQHYRKEKVIKSSVGMMDKSSMVQRKLNAAFPNYSVRSSFLLKEKIVKKAGQAAADVYIFAAVPDTDQFRKTIKVSEKSLASLSGFCLLPIEASDFVKVIGEKVTKGKAKWTVFMGQHRNGGLRQIVTKNGDLALTRMTPIIDTDHDPAQWAKEVHQEFKATMSYLSRFGYTPDDGLDVVCIAGSVAGDLLSGMVKEEINFHTMTAEEAARLLNLQIGLQDDPRYADPLHVAWIGRKSRFLLPMKASQVDKVSKPRQVAMLGSMLLLLAAAFLGYQLFDVMTALSVVNGDIQASETRKAQLEAEYTRELEKKEALGFDVRLVQNSIKVHDDLERKRLATLDVFEKIGKALGRDLRIDNLEIVRDDAEGTSRSVGGFIEQTAGALSGGDAKPQEKPLFATMLRMNYPSTTDVEVGNKEVQDLSARIATEMTGYKVEVTKLLKDFEYTQGLVVEAGELDKKDVSQDFVAEITILGPFISISDAPGEVEFYD